MSIYDKIVIGLFVLAIIIVVIFAIRTKSALKTLMTSAVFGIGALMILHFTESLSGFGIEITPFTLGVSGVFGLPGVICITLAKMLIF